MRARKIATISALKTKSFKIGELHFNGLVYFRVTSQDLKMLQDQAYFSLANFGCRTSASGKLYVFFFFLSRVATAAKLKSGLGENLNYF